MSLLFSWGENHINSKDVVLMLIAVLYLALTMCTPIEYTKNLFIEHISKYMPTRSLIEGRSVLSLIGGKALVR